MVRPQRCRRVSCLLKNNYFKPRGVPLSLLQEIVLTIDELESIRLADFEGLYQEQSAEKMSISRQTFGRIIDSAHKKVAEALVKGKALKIEGGVIKMMERNFVCYECKNEWALSYGTGRPNECPKCKSMNIHRSPQDRGWAKAGRFGQGFMCKRGGAI